MREYRMQLKVLAILAFSFIIDLKKKKLKIRKNGSK